jgi:hypothetical protein
MNETDPKVLSVSLKLSPIDKSDHPIAVNCTNVHVAQGNVYFDFGIVDPAVISKLAQQAKEGKLDSTPPELEGKLLLRVAMSYQVMQSFYRQFQDVLRKLPAGERVKE